MCASKSTQFYRTQYGLFLAYLMLWVGIICIQSVNTASAAKNDAGNVAVWLDVNGTIGPAMYDYIQRGLSRAAEQQAQLVILQMDTPGGLDESMRKIIQEIIASPVPVVSFVAPGGARAASAGTYILYASHIAAMAPATNLGAATPVRMAASVPPVPPAPVPKKSGVPDNALKGELPGQSGVQDAMTVKVVNDAVAYIRGLARMRGRNADWAEKAVREGASLTATEALDQHVIDLVAEDLGDLLTQIDGRTVDLIGQKVTFSTQSLVVKRMEQDWRTRLLAVITDPNVAYILMLIGFYGLVLEFTTPGTIVAGVAGAICLLLALFAFQVLPISYAGLALILFGIIFMLAEALIPGVGVLAIGGITAFVIGSVMLIDTEIPGYGISIPLIITFTLLSAGFFIVVSGMVLRSRKNPTVTGVEKLIHSTGEVLEGFDQEGWVRVQGELWRARSNIPLLSGQKVKITAMQGLLLTVEPCQSNHTMNP
ncbi:nodulation protein NfeD [Nitrosomonas sp.]|uniref:NfeD family protein n=1 Tax=Nitrosomonas sp. TaxID=42353 RepID=UPI0025E1418E|nr:nodulation protein NfeD [Nitrosomonas sp.]MCC6916597.1 nodulation protein NfeD [Nitrosomonas sp.]